MKKRQPVRITHKSETKDDERGYEHLPLKLVRKVKVKYVEKGKLQPRRVED